MKKSLPNEKKNKSKIKHCVPCKTHKEKYALFYLNKDEISALKARLKNDDLILQKSDNIRGLSCIKYTISYHI